MNKFNFKGNGLTEKNSLKNRYKNSRYSLLLLIIFTVLNVILLISKSYTYFLFSATIPYALVDTGMFLTGMYPAEYYEGIEVGEFLDSSVFVFLLSAAILIITVYFLCWLLSSKMRKGWLMAALVLFVLDTLAMFYLYGINLDMIVDVIFHIWVIVDLARGIYAAAKLKKLPAEDNDEAVYDIPTDVQ